MIDNEIILGLSSDDEATMIAALEKIGEIRVISLEEAQIIANLLVPLWKSGDVRQQTLAGQVFQHLKKLCPAIQYPRELLDSTIGIKKLKNEMEAFEKKKKETLIDQLKTASPGLAAPPLSPLEKLKALVSSTSEKDMLEAFDRIASLTDLEKPGAEFLAKNICSFFEMSVSSQNKLLAKKALDKLRTLVPGLVFPPSVVLGVSAMEKKEGLDAPSPTTSVSQSFPSAGTRKSESSQTSGTAGKSGFSNPAIQGNNPSGKMVLVAGIILLTALFWKFIFPSNRWSSGQVAAVRVCIESLEKLSDSGNQDGFQSKFHDLFAGLRSDIKSNLDQLPTGMAKSWINESYVAFAAAFDVLENQKDVLAIFLELPVDRWGNLNARTREVNIQRIIKEFNLKNELVPLATICTTATGFESDRDRNGKHVVTPDKVTKVLLRRGSENLNQAREILKTVLVEDEGN